MDDITADDIEEIEGTVIETRWGAHGSVLAKLDCCDLWLTYLLSDGVRIGLRVLHLHLKDRPAQAAGNEAR